MKRPSVFATLLLGGLGISLAGEPAVPAEEVFWVARDAGHCEARIRIIPDGGCIVRGESEFVVANSFVDVSEGMGEQFVDCGARLVVCGKSFHCKCGRKRQPRVDGGVRR